MSSDVPCRVTERQRTTQGLARLTPDTPMVRPLIAVTERASVMELPELAPSWSRPTGSLEEPEGARARPKGRQVAKHRAAQRVLRVARFIVAR